MHAPAHPAIPSETLLLAYRSGLFPMADGRDDPQIVWVEPRIRAILPLDGFHCSQSLAKLLKQDRFEVTCNEAFDAVIAACAQPRMDHPGSWISHRIERSYRALHRAGHAHSIECWQDGSLVGGLYGVGFDRVFCGESMFSISSNASKVALAWLVAILARANAVVLDCQFMTEHLATLGAVELPQKLYMDMLATARRGPPVVLPEAYDSLVSASSSPGKLIAQSLIQTS